MGIFVAVILAVLLVRILLIQTVDFDRYQSKVIDQLTTESVIKADRGNIYDANGVLLATNITTYRIFISPKGISTFDKNNSLESGTTADNIAKGLSEILGDEYGVTYDAVMNHTTDIEILHPMTTAHYTVFRNIMAQNYQVRVGQRNFPNQNTLNTVGPEFHEMMIDASDFDSIFESNDSYEHSLSDELTDGTRWISSRTDNTSFVPIFRLERDSNGNDVWFDGVNNHSIDVEIKCNPMYSNYNPYSATATTDNTSASPYGNVSCGPKLVTTNELYMIFSLLPDGKPNVQFVINYTYDEARQNKMLDAYAVANVYYA